MRNSLKNYYVQFKTNRLFRTTMKTYFIIACIVFFAYALVMVMNVYHAAISQLTSAELKMLSQSETTNDFVLRDINAAANIAFENESAAKDAMTKPYTPERSYAASTLINNMKMRTSAIDKVYFFNLKDDCIYTEDAPVYNKGNFPDKELLGIIEESSWYKVNYPHILKYEQSDTTLAQERTLLSLYKYSDTSCMAVFVNADVFNSMVNADFNNKNQSMMILQADNIVLSSTNPEQFGTDMSEDKIVKRINKSKNDSGYINYFGRIYCYKKSNTLNSLYICSFRSSSVIVSYIWQFVVILMFALLLILMYLISSIQISMSIFRPFKKLRSEVFNILGLKGTVQSYNMGTEQDLMHLSSTLNAIKSKYESMQKTEMLYSETKRNELIYKIMTGSYSYAEAELIDYDIRFPHPYSSMILIRLDKTNKINRSNIDLLQYGISNSGTEILTNSQMLAYATTYSDEYDVMFLVNHAAEQLDIKYIDMLQRYAKNAFNISVSAAYDTSDSSLDSVSELYLNVKEAMRYRLVKGHNSVISYKKILNNTVGNNAYPAKLEKIIIREINLKNKDKVIEAINTFMSAISSMPYSNIIIYSSMLEMAISLRISSDKNETEQYNGFVDKISRCETIDEIREILIAKCSDAIITSSELETTDKHVMIANSIEEYINTHYNDPNLSIDVIASFVNKSANYTRSIFKQNKNISISEYITNLRFEKVCQLLTDTDMTAQAIAEMAGLNSGSYFYTAFKKHTGYTPDQYRKKALAEKKSKNKD